MSSTIDFSIAVALAFSHSRETLASLQAAPGESCNVASTA